MKQALDVEFGRTVAALDDFTRAAGTIANAGGDKRAGAAFRQVALDSVAKFTTATAVELDRLLSIRIDGFYESMGRTLGIASVIVLLTILVVAWVSRDISNGVASIANAMNRIATGQTGIDIPCRDRGDEIGEMAKATQIFQENLASKLRLEAEAAEHQRAELSAGVAEVENTVSQMESVTQKNAQLVEESSAALTSVDQQAEELATLVKFFSIGCNRERAGPASAGAATAFRAAASAQPAAKRRAARMLQDDLGAAAGAHIADAGII